MFPPSFESGVAQSGMWLGERPEAVRIWLLGVFKVSVGSRTIEGDEWRLKKAASLLKLLALAPSHCLHCDQVMEVHWPDSATRAASNSFRQVLYGARRVLDPTSASHKRYLSLQDEHQSCAWKDE
jgi:DNA-binding SARP family transcriptional activator